MKKTLAQFIRFLLILTLITASGPNLIAAGKTEYEILASIDKGLMGRHSNPNNAVEALERIYISDGNGWEDQHRYSFSDDKDHWIITHNTTFEHNMLFYYESEGMKEYSFDMTSMLAGAKTEFAIRMKAEGDTDIDNLLLTMRAHTFNLADSIDDSGMRIPLDGDFHVVKYVVDPSTSKINGYLDEVLFSETPISTTASSAADTRFAFKPLLTIEDNGQYVASKTSLGEGKSVSLVFDSFTVRREKSSSQGDQPEKTIFNLSNLESRWTDLHFAWTGQGSIAGIFSNTYNYWDPQVTVTPEYSYKDGNWIQKYTKTSKGAQSLTFHTGNWGEFKYDMSDLLSRVSIFETRFKIMPSEQMEGLTSTIYLRADALYESGKVKPVPLPIDSEYHVLRYYVDPTAGKMYPQLDGVMLDTQYHTAFKSDALQQTNVIFMYMPTLLHGSDNHGTEFPDGGHVEWEYDYFKAYYPATSSFEYEEVSIFNMDEGLELLGNPNNHGVAQFLKGENGQILNNVYSDKNPYSSVAVSADADHYVLTQQFVSMWQSRYEYRTSSSGADMLFDPNTVYRFETKLKVESADATETKAQLRLVTRNDQSSGDYADNVRVIIPKSIATDEWHAVSITLDRSRNKITVTLDGEEYSHSAGFPAQQLNEQYKAFLAFDLLTKQSESSNYAENDNVALNTPVTWTIDAFEIFETKVVADPQPEPEPTGKILREKPVILDHGMTYEGNLLSQTNQTTDGESYVSKMEFIDYSGGTAQLLPNGNFQVKQIKLAEWQNRLRFNNDVDSAVQNELIIDFDYPIVFETKFKVGAEKVEDYQAQMQPRIMFVMPNNGQIFEAGTSIPWSEETENITQTIRFVFNPATEEVVGTLNGERFAGGSYQADTMGQIFLGLLPHNPDWGGGDGLDAPVIWEFESFSFTNDSLPSDDITPRLGSYEPLAQEFQDNSGWSVSFTDIGISNAKQIQSKIYDLGIHANINAIHLGHNTDNLMSYVVMVSDNLLNWFPVAPPCPGEVAKYSGDQALRFSPMGVRYVKYQATLFGKGDTGAHLNYIHVSHTDTSSIEFIDLPSYLNTVSDTEIVLHTKATDVNGAQYHLPNDAVSYEVLEPSDGVQLEGNIVKVSDQFKGTIRLKAQDLTNSEKTVVGTVRVYPSVAVKNFGLYKDENHTQPIADLTGKIYANAQITAREDVTEKEAVILMSAYDDQNRLLKVVMGNEVTATENGEHATVFGAIELPDGTVLVKAYLWNMQSLKPFSAAQVYGESFGISMREIQLDKGENISLSAPGNVSWHTSDQSIATVLDGVVTGVGEGTAVITASVGDIVVGMAKVKVKVDTYVFLIMGQSNATGTNNIDSEISAGLITEDDVVISSNVKLLNNSNTFEPASHPYSQYSGVEYVLYSPGSTDGTSKTPAINMMYSFAEQMAKEHPDKTIGVVANTASGHPISVWEKNGEHYDSSTGITYQTNGYANTVERIAAATTGSAQIKGILWDQGQNDQITHAAYGHRMRNMIYDFRSAFGDLEVPFMASELTNYRRLTDKINWAIATNVKNLPSFGFVRSSHPTWLLSRGNLPHVYTVTDQNPDYTHISAKGQIEFGLRYVDKYKELINR